MKTLQSLTQPITQLRRNSRQLRTWLLLGLGNFTIVDKSASQSHTKKDDSVQPFGHENSKAERSSGLLQANSPSNSKPPQKQLPKRGKKRPQLMWLLAVVSLTSVMGNRFYNQPKLNVGTVAPQTIRAPHSVRVEDAKTTEEKRKAARTGSIPVLMLDNSISQNIYQELQQSLDQADALRQKMGRFPFTETTFLSDSTQRYLRQTQEWEWQAISAAINVGQNPKPIVSNGLVNQTDQLQALFFAQAVSELQSYRQIASPQAFINLLASITTARQGYAAARRQIEPVKTDSNHQYHVSLLNLSDNVWRETRLGMTQASKRILTQGIPAGLPPSILDETIKIQLSSLIPSEAMPFATELLNNILQPNLVEDKEQTKRRAEQAAQAVEPVYVFVQRGEVIVQANEKISQANFVLLDRFNLSRRGVNWYGIAGFGVLVSSAVGLFWLVERRVYPSLRQRDHFVVLLLTLSTPLLALFGVPYTDLPAIGLLIGSFYSPALGLTVVSLLTGLVTFSMEVSRDYLLAGAAGGLLGAWFAGRMRSREELALLGVAVGLTQGTVYLLLNLILSAAAGAVWYTVLQEAVLYALAGLSWSVVALGISPYLERVFDLVTPIRLAELSNPNRALLKRLASEAPGTFQHTLFVTSLAEAAARELHCNVELVRAGTLYHDIGKMHDPLGFIENQMGGPNKHDEINDPKKSTEIIKKHVSQGLVMARKHQLPRAIRNFIPEHQGTILVSYFYYQAQQQAEKEGLPPVSEADFRYDGPIPQSRETGVVMLADACEAALRSLKDATPEIALGMINKILKARWQDNQLVDSGLTREDLSTIADVFVKVWQQCNHQRIAYPKGALNV
ncbi:MAG: HD family phosphohydrolase, partial [Coleofasciculaceae cyanobacterium]